MTVRLLLITWLLIFGNNCQAAKELRVTNQNLGIVVNELDPDSVAIGEYYAAKRAIPKANIITVAFQPVANVMSVDDFKQIKRIVDSQSLQNNLQGFAVAWMKPFRVDCMSLTSALALGFDNAYCASGCKTTKPVDYFNSDSSLPFSDHKLRPTMMLAGTSVANVKQLIDKGVASDNTQPSGTAYLLSTLDKNRNVRARGFKRLYALLSSRFYIEILKQNILRNKEDVMFYFTGLINVRKIKSNRFLPGAVADHLTSAGGILRKELSEKEKSRHEHKYQMSVLRWLEAGATASYGTAIEPCNFPMKFPKPLVMMHHYLNGDTVLEAYWKSVQMPGQGVFVGEPLARPFAE